MIAGSIVAILIPLTFLFLVRRLDLYASGDFATVLLCMGAGVAAFLAAYVFNSSLLPYICKFSITILLRFVLCTTAYTDRL